MKSNWFYILAVIGILLLVNIIAANYFKRFDLTEDQRYTLSNEAKQIIASADKPIFFTIYLKGDFPSEFKRLQTETRFLLEEFQAQNRSVKFEFKNPIASGEDAQQVGEKFYRQGMPPENLNTYQNGKTSEQLVFPWAIARYGNKKVNIPLLQKNGLQNNPEGMITNSVGQLEYTFTNGLHKLLQSRKKKIALLQGNGELPLKNLASFRNLAKAYYDFDTFNINNPRKDWQERFNQLKKYDLIVEAKPKENFTENEKYLLDQYVMSGGKALWLMDAVAAEKDSLFSNPERSSLAIPQLLNLTDFFFKYGVRLNPSLVKDLKSAPIILSRGQGSSAQLAPRPWFFMPLAKSTSANAFIQTSKPVKFDFTSPMDTLKNGVKKTILLKSSPRSKVLGTPRKIDLSDLYQKPDVSTFDDGPQNLAVLIEGKFPSVYANRVKPFDLKNNLDKSAVTKMIVVSDGDVIKNELSRGKPLPIGFDRYKRETYGNEDFLLNSLNYLLGDDDLLALRSKEVQLHFLNSDKVSSQSLKWKLINLGAPIFALVIFGLVFRFIRRQKYIKNKAA